MGTPAGPISMAVQIGAAVYLFTLAIDKWRRISRKLSSYPLNTIPLSIPSTWAVRRYNIGRPADWLTAWMDDCPVNENACHLLGFWRAAVAAAARGST